MSSEAIFRIILLLMFLGYIIPRSYYRRKAHRASPEDQLPLKETTESKVRLALLGVCGLSADLLSIAWAINPQWLAWSNLSLPLWLRWLGVLGAIGAVTNHHHDIQHGTTALTVRRRRIWKGSPSSEPSSLSY